MNWGGLATQGTEEEGILGRWSRQGVVMGELAEECLQWSLEVEGEGRVEVGREGCWELRRKRGAGVEEVEGEVRCF